ncbi:MAG TPA: hypothetical protein VHW24_12570 [Bryobacteraceae bacterium]|nr:hypothetical protein [Bryobacteraceae bacterium]
MVERFAGFAVAVLFGTTLANAQAPLQRVNVKTGQSVDFVTGGTVRVSGTAGDLNIETWDQPRVEATLTTTEYANAGNRDAVKQRLASVDLVVEKRGNDVAVEMKPPKRHFWGRWLHGATNATVECRVMIPREAKLVVHHGDGSVLVYGAAGDIDATTRFGDIVVQLPEPARYAMDAKVRMGNVYTDYEGQYRSRVLVGEKYMSQGEAGAHHIRLRVGIGGIDIVKMAADAAHGL